MVLGLRAGRVVCGGLFRGDLRGFRAGRGLEGWGASLHRLKAGRAGVRGASLLRESLNIDSSAKARSPALLFAQPAGRGLEGPSQRAKAGGGRGW